MSVVTDTVTTAPDEDVEMTEQIGREFMAKTRYPHLGHSPQSMGAAPLPLELPADAGAKLIDLPLGVIRWPVDFQSAAVCCDAVGRSVAIAASGSHLGGAVISRQKEQVHLLLADIGRVVIATICHHMDGVRTRC